MLVYDIMLDALLYYIMPVYYISYKKMKSFYVPLNPITKWKD